MFQRMKYFRFCLGISIISHTLVVGCKGAPRSKGTEDNVPSFQNVKLQLESLKGNISTPGAMEKSNNVKTSLLRLLPPANITPGKSLTKLDVNREHPTTSDNSRHEPLGTSAEVTTSNVSVFNDLNFELDYTPRDIAAYIFWTGDERGVAWAINDFLQDGIVSKEDGIHFLEQVKSNLEILKARYSPNIGSLQSSSQPMNKDLSSSWWMELKSLDKPNVQIQEKQDKKFPATSKQNIRNTLGDESADYEDLVERVGQLDPKFREYSLEEVIYHLAKELFSTGLEHEEPEHSIQRFAHFIERQSSVGKIPKDLEKSILDTLVTALVDAITERENYKLNGSSTVPQPNGSHHNYKQQDQKGSKFLI